MFEFFVKCPFCGGIHRYRFGKDEKNTFRIGDMIDSKKVSYKNDFLEKCDTCKNNLHFTICIRDGRFVNISVNATNEEVERSEKQTLKALKLYCEKFDYDTRKSMLLGEDTQIVPSHFSIDNKFPIGEFIPFFDRFWRVDESYKVIRKADSDIIKRIYKVVLLHGKEERLLVTSIIKLPTLREIDWQAECFLNNAGFEIIMETE